MNALWTAVALLATAADVGEQPAVDSETARMNQKISAAMSAVGKPAEKSSEVTAEEQKTASTEPLFAPRKPAEMRTAVSNAMRATATASAKEPAARDAAIRKLILILLEIEQDTNLVHDERVELRTLVHSRLTSLEMTLRAEVQRAEPKPNAQAAKPQAAAATTQVLGQLVNVQRGNGVGNGAVANGVVGAPNQPVVRNPLIGQNGGQFDYGPNLVELIQTVIAPRTWDVNGGPGSVVYYRNLQALVIRAPSDVHGQVGNALGQLRK